MSRRGMTLVEMLVALTATLIMMTAVAQVFAVFGNSITGSRAVLDLDGRMRNAAWRLRSDLAGATARLVPPLVAESGEGYFEIIEGPATDAGAAGGATVGAADHDDAILLTTRNTDVPFLGRAPTDGTTIQGQSDMFESTLAEVAWFARKTPGASNPETYTLYRRQLLVMGYVGTHPFKDEPNALPWSVAGSSWSAYFNLPCDVSVRREWGGWSPPETGLFPNTLADLTRRENRFMHNPGGLTGTAAFPSAFVNHQAATPEPGLIFDPTSQRQGEDVILTNVLAFDVRVFDPGAPVFVTSGSTALVPGDPGFTNTASASGAYVDLGHGVATNSLLSAVVTGGNATKFSGFGQAKSGLQGTATTRRTYDTWSTHYEANGRDEDGIQGPDQGTDGLDNDNDGLFDEPASDAAGDGVFEDLGEAETLPPYPVPLRGVEIRIRCYEPSSRQVRQVTVRHTFVPH
jgi:prepilin-type N-terminal cleavage/methylation domain-containing protein